MTALPAEGDIDAAVLQSVDRAIAELRRGACVLLCGPHGASGLVLAGEAARQGALAYMRESTGVEPLLLLTARRAAALGMLEAPERRPAPGVVALNAAGIEPDVLRELADPTSGRREIPGDVEPAPAPAGLDIATIELTKLARLLPAALIVPLAPREDRAQWARERDVLAVAAREVADYRHAVARSLEIVAEARIPLADAENTRIFAFRPRDGGFEHLAVVIGDPPTDRPVLTRVHSQCFTGDLLGSLRCDCGEQLRGAIDSIAEAGSGVLLYLAQEGRGIGLVNKLRAYGLQDEGADTVEANEQLGFDGDERVYLPAAEMLRRLGFRRVRLLTNNPEKLIALARCGIVVEERVPHSFPSNAHNDFYLSTKAARFGHLF